MVIVKLCRSVAGTLLFPLVTVAATSCSAPAAREYQLNGQVLAVDASRQEVTIRHDDIPQFMPGMTMPFKVGDAALLEGRTPGELVTATLIVNDTQAHLSAITRTGFAALPDAVGLPAAVRQPGEQVADATFVNQLGRERRLADWRGRVVAVTFMYTRCPLPNFCPVMDRNFQAVQEQVRADPALQGSVGLLSVTVDPRHDTPAVLASHAEGLNADPAVWEFLTSPRDGRAFAAQFGVSTIETQPEDQEIVHNLRTAVIDANGRLVIVLAGSEWNPADLVTALRHAREGR